MNRFDNKNFRVSSVEIIGLVVFFCLLLSSVFFFKSYRDTKGLYNIERTRVDYIIQAPANDQVTEISQLSHVDKVTPYYYRAIDVQVGKKKISTNLFIIENISDLDYTSFAHELLKYSKATDGNAIFVTDDFAKNAGVSVGDILNIILDGKEMHFNVSGIYRSDYRQVGGSLLTVLTDDIKEAMKSLKYSGAYIASSNPAESAKYFKDEYSPRGNLRSRDEFDTEEAYERYINTQGQSDTTMATFVTADYVSEIARRNNAKLIRNIAISIISMAVAYFLMTILVYIRSEDYTKHNVLRDVRDNYTAEQETEMYSKYFISVTILMLLANIIIALFGFINGWINLVSPLNIIAICASIALMTVCGYIQKTKLKDKFHIMQKEYEEEKRKAEEAKELIEAEKQAKDDE